MGRHASSSSSEEDISTAPIERSSLTPTSSHAKISSAGLQPVLPVADPVVSTANVVKIYGKGSNTVTALNRINVGIARGELTAIMGPSGSGKSTLMHCMAGLDRVTSGGVSVDGIEVSTLSQRKLTALRRDRIGFIFQSFNLIPTLTAKENITLPIDIARGKVDQNRLQNIVTAVDLQGRLTHRPAELSGGQQQRVACARALIGKPSVIFADEPTGNLDSRASSQVLNLLRKAVDDLKQSVVMVTHDPLAASWADRIIFLVDGQVVAELRNPTRNSVLEALGELSAQAEESYERAPTRDTQLSETPTGTSGGIG